MVHLPLCTPSIDGAILTPFQLQPNRHQSSIHCNTVRSAYENKKLVTLLLAGLAIITTATAQTRPYTFDIAGRNVELSTIEQRKQVFVNITELGKAMGFDVKLDTAKRTVVLSNTVTAVAQLILPANPNGPIRITTTSDTVDAKPGDAICADTSGQCSLRAALQEVTAQKLTREITVPSGTYTLEKGALLLAPTNGTYEIRVKGENKDTTIINADSRDRAFYITTNQRVRLENLTIRNGSTTASGGAIGIDGLDGVQVSVVLRNMKFFANKATVNGGAVAAIVFAYSKGISLEVTNVEFSGNIANNHGGAMIIAPADVNLYRPLILQITDSQFTGNTANGVGGGIAAFNTNFTLQNGVLTQNSSSGAGGGLYMTGSAKITGTQFLKNTSSASNGGGIYSQAASQITDVTLEGNTAVEGGAIAIDTQQLQTLERVKINANEARTSGGGIAIGNAGQLLLKQSIIAENVASSGNGGGVYYNCNRNSGNYSDATGTIISSSLIKNRAREGGGIASCGSPVLLNTTLSGNIASMRGGAIRQFAVSSNALRNIEITNSTFFENQASDTSTNQILTETGKVFMRANILVSSSGKNCSIGGETVSTGFNISSDESCALKTKGDLTSTDPKLAALANNGGGILTHMPLLGSPAIDLIPLVSCESRDARGVTRPQGAACDSGAIERSPTDK